MILSRQGIEIRNKSEFLKFKKTKHNLKTRSWNINFWLHVAREQNKKVFHNLHTFIFLCINVTKDLSLCLNMVGYAGGKGAAAPTLHLIIRFKSKKCRLCFWRRHFNISAIF
jgi:hypothetical protein